MLRVELGLDESMRDLVSNDSSYPRNRNAEDKCKKEYHWSPPPKRIAKKGYGHLRRNPQQKEENNQPHREPLHGLTS
jgi:hypothetical protein